MIQDEKTVKRWHPWKFNIRSLLLAMFVVAAFCAGWAANDWNRSRRRDEFTRAMNYVEATLVPIPDESPLSMPSQEEWERMIKSRK